MNETKMKVYHGLMNETMPKALKDRIYRKVRRNKLTPPDVNLQGRIVPKRKVDHTPLEYKRKREEKDDAGS